MNHKCSNMVANILPADLHQPLDPGGQNSNMSQHGHVAYQIEGNGTKSSMQVHIFSLHTLSTCGLDKKIK